MSTAADTRTDAAALVERFGLKAFVESCLVLEEGVATIRDIDLAMMTGFGILPGPFARADDRGLDDVLAALDRAQAEWGEHFAPPLILRRLVAQGRLGKKTGQGFFPYARPDAGWDEGPVKLETRGATAIAWLDNPPANSISPDVIRALQRIWEHVDDDAGIHALVVASANPMLYCAGADIKAFTQMDEKGGRELLDTGHALIRAFGSGSSPASAAPSASRASSGRPRRSR
jgi:enoyl-CoA hydratase / 3-hydroxyacyl-CoA dehydrogenase